MSKLEKTEGEMNELEIEALERILTREEVLQPMTGFSTRVMRAVREEATAPSALTFPWIRFLPGFLLNMLLLIGCSIWFFPDIAAAPPRFLVVEHLSDPVVRGLLSVTAVGFGCVVSAWATLWWVAPREDAGL